MTARGLVSGALLTLALAAPARADSPIGALAFEAHVEGRTIAYQQFGSLYGTEEYLPGRRVRWSTAPDHCQYGSWYPQGEDICFVYEADPTPTCWTFWLRDGALVALSNADAPGAELYEITQDQPPLSCPGPDVGV